MMWGDGLYGIINANETQITYIVTLLNMKNNSTKNNKENAKTPAIHVGWMLALCFAVISTMSGFEHYEKNGRMGMTVAYIVIGACCLGWVILSYLDERRARVRKEKLEEAQKIAEILSAPLSKYDDEGTAYEKALETLEKKYGK